MDVYVLTSTYCRYGILLVVDGVQEDMVASGTSSGNWSCTPITDYFSYANRYGQWDQEM